MEFQPLDEVRPEVATTIRLRFKEAEIEKMLVRQIRQMAETASKDAFTEEAKAIIAVGTPKFSMMMSEKEGDQTGYVVVRFTIDEGAATDGRETP